MPAAFFQLPPPPMEKVDSPAFRKWFSDLSTKLSSNTFYIPNPYPDQINIVGTYNGYGQLSVNQSNPTGPNLAAGQFVCQATTSSVTGTVVGIETQGYSLVGNNTSPPGVWGIATEAWSGSLTLEPVASAVLQNEVSVISQYHNNSAALVGLNVVFKDRSDALYSGSVLHGSSGSNQFNRYSSAIQIDSQPRSTAGEYCGWATGINFSPNSLDSYWTGSAPVLAVGIDFRQINTSRVSTCIAIPQNQKITFESSLSLGVLYDGTTIGFYSGATRIWGVTNDGTGLMYVTGNTASSATAGVNSLPANPWGFLNINVGGLAKKIPLYNV